MITGDFTHEAMPPKMFLMPLMDNVLKSYCFLWDRKDKFNVVKMKWRDLVKFYNKNCFRTCLRKLNEKGLLSYEDSDDEVTIELVGWDDIQAD